jgi:hypothetical protein
LITKYIFTLLTTSFLLIGINKCLGQHVLEVGVGFPQLHHLEYGVFLKENSIIGASLGYGFGAIQLSIGHKFIIGNSKHFTLKKWYISNRAIVLRINNSNFITKHLLLTPSIGRFLYLNTKKKQIVTGVNFDIGASLLLMTHNRILRRTQEDFNDVVPGIIPAIRMSLFRLF